MDSKMWGVCLEKWKRLFLLSTGSPPRFVMPFLVLLHNTERKIGGLMEEFSIEKTDDGERVRLSIAANADFGDTKIPREEMVICPEKPFIMDFGRDSTGKAIMIDLLDEDEGGFLYD